jgi:uncharacterized membrane protein
MVNPFDLRTILLAKHAQHVVLIHFPIALFLTGVAFDAASRWTKKSEIKGKLAAGARLNIFAAAVTVVPAVATGIVAWQWQLEGKELKGLLLLHAVLGCVSAALIALCAWVQFRLRGSSTRSLTAFSFALKAITVVAVISTGHLGGFLSGVNVAIR